MRTGTAIFILGIIFLAMNSTGFRNALFGLVVIVGISIEVLIMYGSDKPQTIFYDHDAHPAFLLRVGDSCPGDRHVWNGWCVK
jgi:hypothetical protein